MRKIHIRTGKREYMQKDPCELENLAGKPEYRDVLAWFERKLRCGSLMKYVGQKRLVILTGFCVGFNRNVSAMMIGCCRAGARRICRWQGNRGNAAQF